MVEVSLIYHNIISYLEPYLFIIIPQVLDKFFKKNSDVTSAFIDFFMNLSKTWPSMLQFMPNISFHFCNLLNLCSNKHNQCKPCLRNKLCNCIVLFIINFKGDFVLFLPMLHKSVLKDE